MSLTFYFSPMSTSSITEIVLEELGVPFEAVKLDLKKGDTKKPEFVKLNPNAKVPTLVHDGTVLWESAAITMYLGETFGVEKKLYPAAGPKRGEAMKWIVWANVTLAEAASRLMRNTSDWFPAEQRNAKAGEAAMGDLTTCLGILNQSLDGRQFLIGDEYTLVDAHMNSIVEWLGHMKIDLAPHARVAAWVKRCAARPAHARLMARAQA